MEILTFEELLEWLITKGKEERLIAEIDFLKKDIKIKYSPTDVYRDGLIVYNLFKAVEEKFNIANRDTQ